MDVKKVIVVVEEICRRKFVVECPARVSDIEVEDFMWRKYNEEGAVSLDRVDDFEETRIDVTRRAVCGDGCADFKMDETEERR